MPEYDPLLTMSALNMAVVSLHRITSSGDRLILDREYDSIINNLRMGEINADKELTTLYQDIAQVIQQGRLRDDIRATISKANSEKKRKTIKEIITGNILRSFSTNPLEWLKKLAMSSASEYFTQQKEDGNGEQLRLKDDELSEYDKLQRKLLGASWSLLRHYQLPSSYMLRQKDLNTFSRAMNEADPSKRHSMMTYFEGDFAMYAPYWFYRAKAANEAGNSGEAGECFAKFDEVWRPVLRKDPYRAEAMKYKIEGLMRSGVTQSNAGEILKCLEEMRANTGRKDWANNIFAGMVYFSLGDKKKAEECVMRNIDLGSELEISGRILEDMKRAELQTRSEPLPEKPEVTPVKTHEVPKPKPTVQKTLPVPNSKRQPMSDEDFVKLCEFGYTREVEAAIMNGANVNAKDNNGKTALRWAAEESHTETAELLLKHGADVNAKDIYGRTALIRAARLGHTETVEVLLKHGADVNAKDNDGKTALRWAAEESHTETAELLLKHGAEVNAKDNDGRTALIWATREGYTETVELLLKHGADVNVKDKYGDTALWYAKCNRHSNIVQLLRAHGAKEGLLGFLFG